LDDDGAGHVDRDRTARSTGAVHGSTLVKTGQPYW
jgi:hypothetical protein